MKKNFLRIIITSLVSLVFLVMIMGNMSRAQDEDASMYANTVVRRQDWYEATKQTTAFGGVEFVGSFGPTLGIGETGEIRYGFDPLTQTTYKFQTQGIGVGAGGVALGYQGMFGPSAAQDYGIFAGGIDEATLFSGTPGFNTFFQTGGDILQGSYQYAAQQIDPVMAMVQQLSASPATQNLAQSLGAQYMLGALTSGQFGGQFGGGFYQGSPLRGSVSFPTGLGGTMGLYASPGGTAQTYGVGSTYIPAQQPVTQRPYTLAPGAYYGAPQQYGYGTPQAYSYPQYQQQQAGYGYPYGGPTPYGAYRGQLTPQQQQQQMPNGHETEQEEEKECIMIEGKVYCTE